MIFLDSGQTNALGTGYLWLCFLSIKFSQKIIILYKMPLIIWIICDFVFRWRMKLKADNYPSEYTPRKPTIFSTVCRKLNPIKMIRSSQNLLLILKMVGEWNKENFDIFWKLFKCKCWEHPYYPKFIQIMIIFDYSSHNFWGNAWSNFACFSESNSIHSSQTSWFRIKIQQKGWCAGQRVYAIEWEKFEI